MTDWFLDALVRQHGADSQHVKVWLYQKELVSRFVREAVQLEDIVMNMLDLLEQGKPDEAISMGQGGLEELTAIRYSYYKEAWK